MKPDKNRIRRAPREPTEAKPRHPSTHSRIQAGVVTSSVRERCRVKQGTEEPQSRHIEQPTDAHFAASVE